MSPKATRGASFTCVLLLALCTLPVFGDTNIIFDKPSYNVGDTITINGVISNPQAVVMKVIAPNNNLVTINQFFPSPGGYVVQIHTGGQLWKQTGTYTIQLYQNGHFLQKSTFDYGVAVPEFGDIAPYMMLAGLALTIPFFKKKQQNSSLICITRLGEDGNVTYEHYNQDTNTTQLNLQPPQGDGVYTLDGSPPIGTYKWAKKNITYCLVMPDKDNKLVDIPNDHDLSISVNIAFTKAQMFCGIKCTRISDWTKADISIKLDKTDPIFLGPNGKGVMAYCRFPNTTPKGQFTCVLNSSILYSEDGKKSTYNINETILHEAAGHGLGCVHTVNPNDIMYPFYHQGTKPSKMDVYQWQTLYGPRTPPLNPVEVEAFLGTH